MTVTCAACSWLTKPPSDNEADDLLKAALAALCDAPGAIVQAETALTTARKALALLSLRLIKASLKAEDRTDGPPA